VSTPLLLEAAWDELYRQGAVVKRVPVGGLSRGEVAALLERERRRLRAMNERFAPDPAPFDWRAWRRGHPPLYAPAWEPAA
jgi:hypothetical protein